MTEILRRNGDNVALGKSQNQLAMQESFVPRQRSQEPKWLQPIQ